MIPFTSSLCWWLGGTVCIGIASHLHLYAFHNMIANNAICAFQGVLLLSSQYHSGEINLKDDVASLEIRFKLDTSVE